MASIRLFRQSAKPAYWLHICGGCLISLNLILSAAQCIIIIRENFIRQERNLAAYVGGIKLEDLKCRYFIEDSVYHNGYDPNDIANTAVNDIGVILVSL